MNGMLQLFDIPAVGNYHRSWTDYMKPRLYFGITAPDVTFHSYWTQTATTAGSSSVKSSYYQRANSTLAVVTNLGEAYSGTITVNIAALGLNPVKAPAVDAESSLPLAMTNDVINLSIPRHDYRVIQFMNGTRLMPARRPSCKHRRSAAETGAMTWPPLPVLHLVRRPQVIRSGRSSRKPAMHQPISAAQLILFINWLGLKAISQPPIFSNNLRCWLVRKIYVREYDFSNRGNTMQAKNTEQVKQHEDKRAQWERPELRRLAASDARGGNSIIDDGQCGGTGNEAHHSSCFQ
jgi:hypothetical protein